MTKKPHPELNELQRRDTTKNVRIVKENRFQQLCSMGHCVSSYVYMGAGIAAKFNQLFPQIKRKASRNLIPGSVFAYYDKYSRNWIYNLVTKYKVFNQPFYKSLRTSLILMRNHAEMNRIQHIRLPDLGCGLDNLRWQVVHNILLEVFQHSPVQVTVCFRAKTVCSIRRRYLEKKPRNKKII